MLYKYKCDENVITVDVFEDEGFVVIYESSKYKGHCRNIREDGYFKYFKWKNNNIFLKDFIKISKEEIINKLQSGEFLLLDEVIQMVLSEGFYNVKFLVSFTEISKDKLYGSRYYTGNKIQFESIMINCYNKSSITDLNEFYFTRVPLWEDGKKYKNDDNIYEIECISAKDFFADLKNGTIKILPD